MFTTKKNVELVYEAEKIKKIIYLQFWTSCAGSKIDSENFEKKIKIFLKPRIVFLVYRERAMLVLRRLILFQARKFPKYSLLQAPTFYASRALSEYVSYVFYNSRRSSSFL